MLGLVGDVAATIEALPPRLHRKSDEARPDRGPKRFAAARECLDDLALGGAVEAVEKPIHPRHVAKPVSGLAADDAISTFDVGRPTVWDASLVDGSSLDHTSILLRSEGRDGLFAGDLLDPQRFTRGMSVRPRELDAVMMRRLRSDLRHFGERFPERVVEPIPIAGLPPDAPELALARMLAAYAEAVRARAASLPAREASQSRLALVGLQQRLLSSVAAFARTLEVHLRGLDRADAATAAGADAFVRGPAEVEAEPTDEAAATALIDKEGEAAASAAAAAAAKVSDRERVAEMLKLAKAHAGRPDARARASCAPPRSPARLRPTKAGAASASRSTGAATARSATPSCTGSTPPTRPSRGPAGPRRWTNCASAAAAATKR